jgi:hypothetical protein
MPKITGKRLSQFSRVSVLCQPGPVKGVEVRFHANYRIFACHYSRPENETGGFVPGFFGLSAGDWRTLAGGSGLAVIAL